MAQDIIRWVNEKSNKKIISLLLIVTGAYLISNGIVGIGLDYSFETGMFREEFEVVGTILSSFSVTAVFNFIMGILFIVLGSRLFRSAK